MIDENLYKDYLDFLLNGQRMACSQIVQQLLDRDIDITSLYTDLFQDSLYEVGRLWEYNKISVAREHLATAITEGMLNLIYPRLFEASSDNKNKNAVISCAANEYHQIGGKMAADIFELNGWDAHFLGANTPIDHLLEHVQETKPDLVGLSVSVYFNMPLFKTQLEAVRSDFSQVDIFVGGQAFNWGGINMLKDYAATHYIPSLGILETEISK